MPSTNSSTGNPGRGLSADAIRPALQKRAEDLFRLAFGDPLRAGGAEWRPKSDDAIAMQMRGPKRGLWHDFSADEGGDLFDLVAITHCDLNRARDDFGRVLEEAARFAVVTAEDSARARDRQADRERDARLEKQQQLYRWRLVASLQAAARPVEGTPAELYLRSRGIKRWPTATVAYLPPVPGLYVNQPGKAALVLWTTDAAGAVRGGQRILINAEGRRVGSKVRKPAFADIKGYPVRFPGQSDGGPLIVAEGPETALSIWHATRRDTWAVLSASNFEAAPLPLDRPVILAPDHDAPDSPAGRSFWRAVAVHLQRGCELWIAYPPERAGNKRDYNDTLMGHGPEMVRRAIDAAWRFTPDPTRELAS